MDLPTYDLRLLAPFAVVGRELHFGRAASLLGMNQPALSQQIARLERQLGTRLLRRDRHGVALTPAGARFLVEAREIVVRMTAAEAVLREGARRELAIHVGDASNPMVRHVLSAFSAAQPAVTLRIAEGTLSDASRAVVDGAADVGFDMPDALPAGLGYATLERPQLGVACAADHPLASSTEATWEDLRDATLLVAPPGVADGFNLFLRAQMRHMGIGHAEAVVAVSRGAYLAGHIAAGRGLLIAPAHVVAPLPTGVAWLPLRPIVTCEIGVVWRPETVNETVAGFLRWILRESAARTAADAEHVVALAP